MSDGKLFHVSEDPNIGIFHPRPVPDSGTGTTGEAVWAVDEAHLCNYLLPRDCPRVTFAEAGQRVVAVEESWLERIRSTKLYVYEFSSDFFECLDPIAGYYISRSAVRPLGLSESLGFA